MTVRAWKEFTLPILAEEISMFPEDLLANTHETLSSTQSNMRWSILCTKARQEKALARDLLVRETPFFLPLGSKETLIRGRRVRSFYPLFAGYVFLFADDDQRIGSLTTNRVAYHVDVVEQQRLQCELGQLHRLITSEVPFTLEKQLVPGERVRVKSGPFLGIVGTLTSHRGKGRLLIAVHYLGQGVSMEIDDSQVEPV